jgi:hypothetical protein
MNQLTQFSSIASTKSLRMLLEVFPPSGNITLSQDLLPHGVILV